MESQLQVGGAGQRSSISSTLVNSLRTRLRSLAGVCSVSQLIAASEALSNFRRRRICGSVNFLGGRAMVLIFLAPKALRTIFGESIVR